LINDCRPVLNRDGSFDPASPIMLEASIFVGFDFVAEVAMKVSALLLILVDKTVDRLMTYGSHVMLWKLTPDLFGPPLLGGELGNNVILLLG
jgi:hypothetical protein